jgi:hypothetical protein
MNLIIVLTINSLAGSILITNILINIFGDLPLRKLKIYIKALPGAPAGH